MSQMIRSILISATLAAAVSAAVPAAAQDESRVFGEAQACGPSARGPAVLMRVSGFRDRSGNLRAIIYRANEDEFLASGKYVTRLDIPVTKSGPMTVCATVPEPGPYAIIALHDRNADGKLNPFNDGVGFANNPRLSLSKPPVSLVKANVVGVVPMSITLNYVQGLSVKPWPQK